MCDFAIQRRNCGETKRTWMSQTTVHGKSERWHTKCAESCDSWPVAQGLWVMGYRSQDQKTKLHQEALKSTKQTVRKTIVRRFGRPVTQTSVRQGPIRSRFYNYTTILGSCYYQVKSLFFGISTPIYSKYKYQIFLDSSLWTYLARCCVRLWKGISVWLRMEPFLNF